MRGVRDRERRIEPLRGLVDGEAMPGAVIDGDFGRRQRGRACCWWQRGGRLPSRALPTGSAGSPPLFSDDCAGSGQHGHVRESTRS